MVIGGFVLGALILFVAAILLFSSGVLFQDKLQLVSYFPGTVQGLSNGARVEFEGVQVGQVTEIALEYHADDGSFSIPVHYEIWSDHISIVGGDDEHNFEEAYRMLIEERGLRAKLENISLLTGQYMIALSLQPDTAINLRGSVESDVLEIPTLEADRDRLANVLEGIEINQLINSTIQAMNALHDFATNDELRELITESDQTLAEARRLIARLDTSVTPLLERIDETMIDYSALAKTSMTRVNSLADSLEQTSVVIQDLTASLKQAAGRVSQSATGALERADKTLASIDNLVGEDSGPRYDLELLLEEAAGAARSLRILADYLQQNPDALIRGK